MKDKLKCDFRKNVLIFEWTKTINKIYFLINVSCCPYFIHYSEINKYIVIGNEKD